MGVLIRRASMFHLLLFFCCLTAFPHRGTLVHGSISEMMAMMPSLMEMMKGEYSASEMMLARAAYINATSMPCSAGGKTTEDCCSNCDYCPQCPTDCVKSGYCGQQCNVTSLPDNRPCL